MTNVTLVYAFIHYKNDFKKHIIKVRRKWGGDSNGSGSEKLSKKI